ncbi:MAG: adenylate/guanylate cyclase domain-containing protein [Actinobacteria bacterium]|nr:adenylate/guanylate cyclase domain-containing protein [Actinomycetota bacterium]
MERPEAPSEGGILLVSEVRRRLTWLGWIAGAVGSLIVFNSIGFLIPIFIGPHERGRLALLNAPVVVVYLLISGAFLVRRSRRHLMKTLDWIVHDRPPDEREHADTLNLAVYGVKMFALSWLVGGVVFCILNGVAHSAGFAAVVGATIWLGGETTCAVEYLVSERILRPVTACALGIREARGTAAPGVRARLGWAWSLGTGVPLLGLLVVGTVGLTKSGVHTKYVAAAVLFLGVVALVIGLLLTMFAAKAVADPVTSVRSGLEGIARGELDLHVEVDDASEIGLLQAGFNRMAEGLRERERIRDLFGRQVGEDVARAALRGGTRLGGEEREVGALFVDIVGSTSMALAMPPTELVRVLNRFFRVVIEAVESEGGLVNKFEGDAALCVFGAPVRSIDAAGDALRAARRLAAHLARDVPEIDFGIGISAGIAVAGNVGAEHRFEYTVIGDPVNEAARLSELARQRPERVLASNAALDRAGEDERSAWSVTESALLRGRNAPTGVAHPRL